MASTGFSIAAPLGVAAVLILLGVALVVRTHNEETPNTGIADDPFVPRNQMFRGGSVVSCRCTVRIEYVGAEGERRRY
jgi:hypothetical protein